MGIAPEFALFVAVIAGTPGPLNLMLLSTGLSGRPHAGAGTVVGAALGYGLLFAAASAAARQIAAMDPATFQAMQVVSACLLLWIAWRLLRARPAGPGAAAERGGLLRGVGTGLAVVLLGAKSIPSAASAGVLFCDGRLSPIEHAVGFGATATVLVLTCCTPWLLAGLTLSRRAAAAPRMLRGINLGGAACLAGMAGVMVF